MEDETFKCRDEDYKFLDDALTYARTICPPDQYQYRQNKLIEEVATFLLTPYWEKNRKNKSTDE